MKKKFILFSPWLLKSPDKGSIRVKLRSCQDAGTLCGGFAVSGFLEVAFACLFCKREASCHVM